MHLEFGICILFKDCIHWFVGVMVYHLMWSLKVLKCVCLPIFHCHFFLCWRTETSYYCWKHTFQSCVWNITRRNGVLEKNWVQDVVMYYTWGDCFQKVHVSLKLRESVRCSAYSEVEGERKLITSQWEDIEQ